MNKILCMPLYISELADIQYIIMQFIIYIYIYKLLGHIVRKRNQYVF